VAAVAQGAEQYGTAPYIARDLSGVEVLSANARIPTLDWTVFVELPLAEAFKPVYASMQRLGLLLLDTIAVGLMPSLLRTQPVAIGLVLLIPRLITLVRGKSRPAHHRVTGDELESLASQFNNMAAQLQESYSGLEQKVEERTRELSEALEQQTGDARSCASFPAHPPTCSRF
jgi:hypothetical protein